MAVLCPVCGFSVDAQAEQLWLVYGDRPRYACSQECAEDFIQQRWVEELRERRLAAIEQMEYRPR